MRQESRSHMKLPKEKKSCEVVANNKLLSRNLRKWFSSLCSLIFYQCMFIIQRDFIMMLPQVSILWSHSVPPLPFLICPCSFVLSISQIVLPFIEVMPRPDCTPSNEDVILAFWAWLFHLAQWSPGSSISLLGSKSPTVSRTTFSIYIHLLGHAYRDPSTWLLRIV